MEYLLLGALLYSRIPDCPKPFVKTLRDNVYVSADRSPSHACRYVLNGHARIWKGTRK